MIDLIRADVLELWANRVTAFAQFPRLIRLLIQALVDAPKLINFPADDATRLAGYDGQLEISLGVRGLPDGLSVWELGTEKNVKSKADADYRKRTDDPLGVVIANTTFVFATPRKWPSKVAWANERSAEGHWKQVLAFDAEDIVQWLEAAPAVALWFGQLAGQVPDGARSLFDVIAEYRLATKPEFDPAGTLLGRDAQRTTLVDVIESDPKIVELEAATDQEAAAFVGACIGSLPPDRQDKFWARAIWLDDERSLRRVAPLCQGHLLVLAAAIVALPVEARQHSIIRITPAGSSGTDKIVLGKQPMSALIEFVEKQGIDRNEAFRRCYDADASLERVRRGLMTATPPPPAWSDGIIGPSVAAAILIGAWDEANTDDQTIVAEISRAPYAEFARAISAWTQGAHPLVTRAGSEWNVHDRLGAWRRLEPYVVASQLDALSRATETVLLAPDPRFDLAPTERWLANIHGKRRRFSSCLRNGLAEGLLLTAIKGDVQAPCYAGVRPQDIVNRCVRSIFQKQFEASFWRRVRGELKELAEASPEIFLDSLERDLAAASPQVLDLLEDEGDNGSCLQANLLWALEALAWSPAYVGRVALILAVLAAKDPGGRYSNRPVNSLAAMFNPSQPQCTATAENRHALISELAKAAPAVAARLCETMLRQKSGFIDFSCRPALRAWAPIERVREVLLTEYWADVQAASKQLFILADTDPERWQALLSELNRLPPDFREKVLLEAEARAKAMGPQARLVLRNGLRKLLHRHNQFRGRKKEIGWLYKDDVLEQLYALYTAIAPNDLIQRHAWLFEFHVDRPVDISDHWQDELAKIEAERLAAAEQLIELGMESIIGSLKEFQDRRALGYALGSSSAASRLANGIFISYAETDATELRELIQGFAAALYKKDREGFIATWVTAGGPRALSEKGAAILLAGLPSDPEVWDVAMRRGAECDSVYWHKTFVHLFDRPLDGEQAARKLLAANRPLDAIAVLARNVTTKWLSSDGDAGLVVDVLLAGVAAANANPGRIERFAYDVTTVLKHLSECKKIDDSTLTKLEWAYFGILEHHAEHDLIIHKRLIADPNLLVDLLALLYRPEGAPELREEPAEQERRLASQAWDILHAWHPFEKTRSMEMPALETLTAYSEKLRAIAKDRGFAGIADYQLGRALSSCPVGVDGIWPHEVVRKQIEQLHSPQFDEGFVLGKENARGVTMRGIGDGGILERQLAQQYRVWQKAVAIEFPKTSALLGRLAEHYESDAQRMDIEDRRRH